jgi:nitrous oxidase accessory protein NosD
MAGALWGSGGTKMSAVALVALCTLSAPEAVLAAVRVADPAATSGPNYYLTLLGQLQPGDTLELPAGTYRQRLNLNGLQGTAAAWITITGPAAGAPAIITTDSTCCNNVQLGNTAYVVIKNLTIDANSEGLNTGIDAINAKDGVTHDILIENCVIRGAALDQGTVGISTKSTAWNWIIRRNRILDAGTGIYLGNSDGSAPFVAGVIENNLIVDTIGYNIEIKYQNAYTAPAEMPGGARRTIIRDNVFIKQRAQSSWPAGKVFGIRPNLLVGGFPDSGAGVNDLYEIYGNFFYKNADGESLIQASGRVAIHDNVFVGADSTSIYLIDHDRPLRYADVYNNTVYGGDRGIRFASTAREQSRAIGNLVFADSPISGSVGTQAGNITAAIAQANQFVASPSTQLGTMNFYPLPGKAQAEPLDLSAFAAQADFDRDFNATAKGDYRYRGAYAGEGTNAGWQLDAALKAVGVRPQPPTNVRAD